MPNAHIVIGAFAADGPEQCSGLPAALYSPGALGTALGSDVEPMSCGKLHRTPGGAVQPFTWLAACRP